jgi:uncharacterized repeat protein (TIGR03833 family)
MDVWVILKKDQPTGKLTAGVVQALLTRSPFHPRGIKVRLRDGRVGRVQALEDGAEPGPARQ